MKILAIDTSNNVLGIGITINEQVVGEYITNVKGNHSVRAMPAIDQLMKDCGVKPKDLNKIVVAKGPGSYTGVRIGVTIAKTLAWTLKIPLVGVSSLQVMAANGMLFDGYVSPIFDARRGQIYTGLYEMNKSKMKTVIEDKICQSSDWGRELLHKDQSVLFLGNDISIHKEIICEELGERAIFADASMHNPRPGNLALLGKDEPGEDIHGFVPNYIRLVEAEANWLKQQKGKQE